MHAQKSAPFFDGRIRSLEYHLRTEPEHLIAVGRFTAFVGVLTGLRPAILVGGNHWVAIRLGVHRPEEVHATIGERPTFVRENRDPWKSLRGVGTVNIPFGHAPESMREPAPVYCHAVGPRAWPVVVQGPKVPC